MSKTILIIDDNQDIRENTAEILEIAGYKTLVAANGKTGIEIALKEKPDVIVCDIMMPEIDGYELLHLLRKNIEARHIPFIFLTAKTEGSDFRKGMELGADDYLTKPFTQLELLNAVENRLNKTDILKEYYAPNAEGVQSFMKDVKNIGLLQHMEERYAAQLFTKKNFLYQEGKRPRYLFYLIKGKIKAYKTHEDGKEYITNLYNSNDFIGYIALLEDANYDDSAVIMEDAEVMLIPRDDFTAMIYSDASVAEKFIKLITQNVKEKEDRMIGLAYGTLRKRVAEALVGINRKFNTPEKQINILEMTREDVARYVGTATESLIRTISDFKSEGLVDVVNGKIRITDIKKLENLLY
ncbi:MAG: response regulator [Panacibacter sp.]